MIPERAMVVVGGGTSARFGADKLLVEIAGRPLISHTVSAVEGLVDLCVVVCHPHVAEVLSRLHPGVSVAEPGSTRTGSEMSGLAAIGGEAELIGVHDAARPAVSPRLVDELFRLARLHGGAVPVMTGDEVYLERRTHRVVPDLARAQTPQVFRGPELLAGYVRAARAGFDGHDTAEVAEKFTDLEVVAVPGDPDNRKVTYPEDLEPVRRVLTDPSRI